MSNYLISDLEHKYLEYLYKHIPILEYGIDGNNKLYNSKSTPGVNKKVLLQLILNYCKECESTKPSKESNIIGGSLKVINNILQKFAKVNPDPFNSNKYKIEYNKNKVIKKFNINAKGLIEGIIFATFNYYNDKSNLNVILNNRNKKIKLVMNKAQGKDLANYIIDLYKSNNKNKDSELFKILIEISKKLEYYQQNYGFIHGDFHSENIFIYKNNGEYIITFIDFEYSTIKLPSNNKNIILTAPVSENISRKNILNLDEKNEYPLKALDLFHLIENLKSFLQNSNTIKAFGNNYNQFKDFINKLDRLYPNRPLESKIHISTRKENFFNNSFSNLYPENFSKINLNNLPSIPFMNKDNNIFSSKKREGENLSSIGEKYSKIYSYKSPYSTP